MATIPAYSPIHIPFLGLIPGGFRQGHMVRIRGNSSNTGERLTINFQCGPILSPQDDIALHISIRFNEFSIVRNHYENLRWGVEERSGGFPLRCGHQYEILVLAEPAGFKIAIDGRHFCDFRHRIALSRVQFINISGQTEVSLIGYETDKGAPVPSQSATYDHHHHHHQFGQELINYPPIQMPIAPSAPSVPVTGIVAAPYPGPVFSSSSTLYPKLPTLHTEAAKPMPIPMSINPSPPPPYAPTYIHQTIETNTFPPPPYSSSPYPGLQQSIKQEHAYPDHLYPVYTAEKKKSGNTALKVAAIAGGVGLGAYALSKVFDHSSSSDSD